MTNAVPKTILQCSFMVLLLIAGYLLPLHSVIGYNYEVFSYLPVGHAIVVVFVDVLHFYVQYRGYSTGCVS